MAGKVQIRSILYPGKGFACLAPLGEPLDKMESHTSIGDEYDFFYQGFRLHYSNVAEGALMLVLIELKTGKEAFIDLQEYGRISTSRELKSQFVRSNIAEISLPDAETFSIKFHDADGSFMTYEREGTEIKKISIRF